MTALNWERFERQVGRFALARFRCAGDIGRCGQRVAYVVRTANGPAFISLDTLGQREVTVAELGPTARGERRSMPVSTVDLNAPEAVLRSFVGVAHRQVPLGEHIPGDLAGWCPKHGRRRIDERTVTEAILKSKTRLVDRRV